MKAPVHDNIPMQRAASNPMPANTAEVIVLQRVGQHPAARVGELTPRMWMQHFAHAPLRSDLHAFTEPESAGTGAPMTA